VVRIPIFAEWRRLTRTPSPALWQYVVGDRGINITPEPWLGYGLFAVSSDRGLGGTAEILGV